MRSRGAAIWAVTALLALSSSACEDDGPSAGRADDHGDHDHGRADDHSRPALREPADEQPEMLGAGSFDWKLPPGFPRPKIPADNPISAEKVELGRYVFYDRRLSDNQTFSCASCHKQAAAFADERAVSVGSTGEYHTRSPMSLANVAYAQSLTWANPMQTALERQAEVPIFGIHPVELGMMSPELVEERFRAEPMYRDLFAAAFPEESEPISMANLLRALASFQRTLISGNSDYDRYLAGNERAMSEAAKRGMRLVTTNEDPRFECNHCHGGFAFTDHVTWEGAVDDGQGPIYHQTGLYDIDGEGGYPDPNTGVYAVTNDPADMGKFKAPTLRNLLVTSPYMHDGSLPSLAAVLDHYAKGGRAAHAGRTDPLLKPFEISPSERNDIFAFLRALDDEEFLENPAQSDPFRGPSAPDLH